MDFVDLVRQALDRKSREFVQTVETHATALGFDPDEFKTSLRPLLLEVIDKYFPVK